MKWFNDCSTVDQVKKRYKELALKHHPDRGGNLQDMQEINTEYTFAIARALKGENLSSEQEQEQTAFNEQYRQAIENISMLEGLIIEVVGYWLWVTGSTYEHKGKLKDAGFLFASKKRAWFFRTDEHKFYKRNGENLSLDDIRHKYGSEKIKAKSPNFLNK